MSADEPQIVDDNGHLNEDAFQPWDAPLVREYNRLVDDSDRASDWELRTLMAAFAVPYLYLIATSPRFTWAGLGLLIVIFVPMIWSVPRSVQTVGKAKVSRFRRRRQAEEAAALFELADAVQHDEDREVVGERIRALFTHRLPLWKLAPLVITPMVMLTGTWLLFGGDLLPTLVGSAALIGVAAVLLRKVDTSTDRMADIAVHLLVHPSEEA